MKGKEAKLTTPPHGFLAAKWPPRDVSPKAPSKTQRPLQVGSKSDRLYLEPAALEHHAHSTRHERWKNKRGTKDSESC